MEFQIESHQPRSAGPERRCPARHREGGQSRNEHDRERRDQPTASGAYEERRQNDAIAFAGVGPHAQGPAVTPEDRKQYPEAVEAIRARCTEDGGCWLWTGATNSKGHPKIFTRRGDSKTTVPGRRVVYEAVHGEVPAGGLMTVTCECVGCLNPDHIAVTNKSEVSRKSNARESVRTLRRASSARALRAIAGKITMEIAQEIRASEKTGRELAKELGCSPSLVSHVRQYRSWVDLSNPFAGLVR